MKFQIDQEVFDILPDLVVGLSIIRGFDNTNGQAEALSLLRQTESTLRSTMTLADLWNDPRVTVYLEAFKKFGTDPEIRRPAHVALAKRVLEGGQLPDINPIVNIYNAFSLKHLTPFGGENLDVLKGDFRLFVAKGGEMWYPIGADKPKPAIAGELVWGDDIDLSTRALNWRQCDRTKMLPDSSNGFFVMDGFRDVNKKIIVTASIEFIETGTTLCGGSAQMYWMDRENPVAEIL